MVILLNGDDDDLAMALGHLSLSYVSLECMLVRLIARLRGDGDLTAADHELGRRGFSERISMVLAVAGQFFVRRNSLSQHLDVLDLLLKQARDLAFQRHRHIHQKRAANWRQCRLPVPVEVPDQQDDPTPLWDLVEAIDSLVEQFDAWCQSLDKVAS